MKKEKLIMHVDANSAFLSWSAVWHLQRGDPVDLRTIPSVIGGNEASRHGIVLAKSTPAKKYKIETGEPLIQARDKCKGLVCIPPQYDVYVQCSAAMHEILCSYTPKIQRFSIDESFLDFSDMQDRYPDTMKLAWDIKERIKNDLGFTVNIGISNNKLLAKMGGDLKKPDMIHTLFPDEIKEKMWPLPVRDLFMVGGATEEKLHDLNIYTIGELANYDVDILQNRLKSHGVLVWQYANGIDNSEIRKSNYVEMKGIGNSCTIPFDVNDRETAHKVILSLAETIGMRLRNADSCCRLVSVGIRDTGLIGCSRQHKFQCPTNSTGRIAAIACYLFDQLWDKQTIRGMSIHVSELCGNEFFQTSFLEEWDSMKTKSLDKAIDSIRQRYGTNSLIRATFLHSGISPASGGGGDSEEYPNMTSML